MLLSSLEALSRNRLRVKPRSKPPAAEPLPHPLEGVTGVGVSLDRNRLRCATLQNVLPPPKAQRERSELRSLSG